MAEDGAQSTRARMDEAFDRPIALVDSTRAPEADGDGESRRNSRSPSWRQLAKRPTNSVKEGLARWKYSKWQQDRYASGLDVESQTEESTGQPAISRAETSQLLPPGVTLTQTETSDFALRKSSPDRGRERVKKTKEEAHRTKSEKEPYEVDVLYENQRGWFFFGIPLYSHSSLLNLDPAPWTTKDGKDSAVDITNAQVPDPNWEWAWKSWYVDMSNDVDEEGWQYSFSFSRNFSWHGTHPWFHCFVRRRRWLRKRIKKQEMRKKDALDMAGAHAFTGDYFTIHTKRGRSPGSGLENITTRGSSHMSRVAVGEENLPPEDIKDIPSLMKALRLATIDREKIDAVTRFVETGGEELVYLQEHILEIMGLFVFQVSRRHLLEYMNKIANEASREKPSDKAGEQRVNNLQNAVRVAHGQIGSLEYWSDRQYVLRAAGEDGQGHQLMFSESSAITMPRENNPVDEIKGIADDAEVGIHPTERVLSLPPDNMLGWRGVERSEKAKSREGETAGMEEDEQNSSDGVETPIRLPPDSLKVDDK
ncbi:hypothetical protein GJ744_012228 [Endocarpon pusillum]|uniref:Peroxin/Ferlin domain-containing protein n=1 Tax=Endocarpon pusillum TaxID=364733 RepID=A0A8H7AFE9_9EURO|nr:hypothetical protein GJ744_012228 [Endocarpon pusillum]